MTVAYALTAVGARVKTATLLDDISLSVSAGETVAIVGPNGAGKSTLMRILSGDFTASSGSVQLRGRNIAGYRADELAAARAVLSQHIQVTFPFTVDEIIRMGGGQQPRAVVDPLVAAALTEADLTAFAHRELPTLSGGEQQRAHFARVLVQLACGETGHGPGALLLDEPTSSLDLRHQINLLESARRRAGRGTAVIAVLHDLNLAARFADRIVVLRKGRLVADGTPAETITDQLLKHVFEVDANVGRTPEGLPFVLPQQMAQIA
ncbi:heme ABC transporter ATP-binding protein [Bradyrhizobium prioriisuperbiae]|uniref:heme ABC transporter ATP-binding protein n=1 Tax=Bradyrhizobium prioriisuperbiae TaxID=2854389 RepID=UPI0028EF308C|nr:heme ABC transporter ATP-binding protein [Bradyrhizobium prioritasuperba]